MPLLLLLLLTVECRQLHIVFVLLSAALVPPKMGHQFSGGMWSVHSAPVTIAVTVPVTVPVTVTGIVTMVLSDRRARLVAATAAVSIIAITMTMPTAMATTTILFEAKHRQ